MTKDKPEPRSSISRDDVVDFLRRGEWSREQAEAWARDNSELPFIRTLPPNQFNPMTQAYWTLPMSAAWIIWRTPEKVREHWNEFRRACTRWKFRERVLPDEHNPNGRIERGWEAVNCEDVSVRDVLFEAVTLDPSEVEVQAQDVAEMLRQSLLAGNLVAFGIVSQRHPSQKPGTRVQIPQRDWLDLTFHVPLADRGDSIGTFDAIAHYHDVQVERGQVLAQWKGKDAVSISKAARDCGCFLREAILGSPTVRPKPKAEYRKEACERFRGLTAYQFNREWAFATKDTPEWRRAGAPRKSNRSVKKNHTRY